MPIQKLLHAMVAKERPAAVAKDSGGRQEAAEKSREPAELVPLVRCVCSRHALLPLLHVDARTPA